MQHLNKPCTSYISLLVIGFTVLITLTTSSCNKKDSLYSNRTTEKTSSEVDSIVPNIPKQPVFNKRETGFQVRCLIWSAQGQNSKGYAQGIVDPTLNLSNRWISWKPDGTILPGRQCASPFMWSSEVNMNSYGKQLVIYFQFPPNETNKLENKRLLNTKTGETLNIGHSVLSKSTSNKHSLTSDRVHYISIDPTHGILVYHINSTSNIPEDIIIELEYEDGSIYHI